MIDKTKNTAEIQYRESTLNIANGHLRRLVIYVVAIYVGSYLSRHPCRPIFSSSGWQSRGYVSGRKIENETARSNFGFFENDHEKPVI